jgi:hypothetical protein
MARDILAIQGSSVPSEHLFSQCGLTDTKHRNQLNPKTLEAIQILKDAYKKSIIDPDKEAEKWAPQTLESASSGVSDSDG